MEDALRDGNRPCIFRGSGGGCRGQKEPIPGVEWCKSLFFGDERVGEEGPSTPSASLSSLRISPAGSDARKAAQVEWCKSLFFGDDLWWGRRVAEGVS